MPLSKSSATISDGSTADDFSHYSDARSTFDDCEAANSHGLSEQTLLKQAFRVAVHSRRSKAKDWRRERESQFLEDPSLSETTDSMVTKNTSYSSKIRSLLRTLAFAGTKVASFGLWPCRHPIHPNQSNELIETYSV